MSASGEVVAKGCHLIVVGELLLDVIASGQGHGRIAVRAGGTAGNAALAARTLGADATVVARVGADDTGAFVRASLAAAGVRAALAVDPDRATGCFVQVGSVIAADRGASAALRPPDVGDLDADAVLVSGYVLFHDDTAEAGLRALAATARWRGADLGSAPLAGRMPREQVVERLSGANVIFVNQSEAEVLTGLQAESAALELSTSHEVAVVKMGAAGAVAASNSRVVRAEAPAAAGPTTGAGDAFDAGVLVGLVARLDLADALMLGTRCAEWALAR